MGHQFPTDPCGETRVFCCISCQAWGWDKLCLSLLSWKVPGGPAWLLCPPGCLLALLPQTFHISSSRVTSAETAPPHCIPSWLIFLILTYFLKNHTCSLLLLLLSSVFSWLVCEHSDSSLTGSMESSVQWVKVNFLTFLILCSRWRRRRAREVDGTVCRAWSWEDWWHVEEARCGWTVGHSQQNSDFRGVGSKAQTDCRELQIHREAKHYLYTE